MRVGLVSASLLALTLLGCSGDPNPQAGSDEVTNTRVEESNDGAVTPSVPSVDALDAATKKAPVKSPFAGPATDDTNRALEILYDVMNTWGRDIEQPWALSHALLAMGPELQLKDGRTAVDALVSEYADLTVRDDGQLRVTFPQVRDGLRVETHTELFLKIFSEIGVTPEHVFAVQDREITAREIWLSALARSYIDTKGGASYATPNDVPWSLQALTAWADGKKLVWQTDGGQQMSLDFLADFTLAVLEKETAFLKQARAARATFEKRGQGIFQYTCGGAHLLQGAGFAVGRGYGLKRGPEFIREQIALHFYRLPRELQVYDDALRTYGESQGYQTATDAQRRNVETRLLVQRMKFLGHWLETTHNLGALSLFYADKDGAMAMLQARRALALLVETMGSQGVFERLAEIRTRDEQLFLDIIGDAAHAVVALELATGARSVQP